MSVDFRKTSQSKRQTRHELAALPFTEKLRILERLQEDLIVGLKENWRQRTPIAALIADRGESPLFELIQNTVEGLPIGQEARLGSGQERSLARELEAICARPERRWEALTALFPEGVPADSRFYERLDDLRARLGWGEPSRRLMGLLVSIGLERLSPPDAEALLRELARWESPSFYRAFESLGDWVTQLKLRPQFAAEWFPALVRRIGNDSAARGFWHGLGVYCEQYPQDALEVLRFLRRPKGEEEVAVAAYMLGTLRSLDVDASASAAFTRLEVKFSGGQAAGQSQVLNRSWVQTACRGKLRVTDLEFLTQRMWAGGAAEQEAAFRIVCDSLLSPAISPECLAFGVDWLRRHASESISPVAKSHVVDLAVQLRTEDRQQAAGLILAVQPIAPGQRGAWQRIEHFMVALLDSDLALFNDFFVKFARRNSENWLHLLQAPRQFEWLLSEMRGKDFGQPIKELMFAGDPACRLIGRFFFDQLGKN